MDTVVDRLIRYAKVYSESDYHAGRAVTPSTQRQFDMAKLLVEELHGLGIENARYESATSTPPWMPRRACNICPPSASSPTWTPPRT